MSSDRNQRVLITGASGVIGTALAEELLTSGYTDVVAVGSRDADLRDPAAAEGLISENHPAIVYHLAARVHGIMGNALYGGEAFIENLRINTNVVEAARAAGVRKIVAMGSAAGYSDVAPRPLKEDDFWLGKPHGSEGPYAQAKRTMLAHLEAYHSSYGLDFAYAISTNLYGPHDKFDEATGHVLPSLVSKFRRAAKEGTPVSVWGSGRATRDFLYSKDAARALRMIGEEGHGSFNLATGQAVPVREAVETLAKISGVEQVEWDASKPDGQLVRSYDVSRLRALGFEPRFSLEEGLRVAYEWYDANAAHARR